MTALPPAIFIMGPTGSGKTSLALEVARQYSVEIINVDSASIYREMDIGTSKPDDHALAVAPHHLINICDPTEAYSAAQFREDALALMHSITDQGKIPLLVGGTMLYHKALLQGLSDLPSADPDVRQHLEDILADKGLHYLHKQLEKIDPVAAQKIHPNDPQRIQRALEVFEVSGKPISVWWSEQTKNDLPFLLIKLATMPEERALLHKNIEKNFDDMLLRGFVEEVQRLKARGDLDLDKPSMRCIGYRQIWQYLDGELSYKEMRDKGVAASRQYAKRQLTWLRSENDLNWINTARPDAAEHALEILRQKIHGSI